MKICVDCGTMTHGTISKLLMSSFVPIKEDAFPRSCFCFLCFFLALLELVVTKAEDDFDVELIVVLLSEPPHDGSPPYKEQIACLVTPTFDDGVSYC